MLYQYFMYFQYQWIISISYIFIIIDCNWNVYCNHGMMGHIVVNIIMEWTMVCHIMVRWLSELLCLALSCIEKNHKYSK